MVPTEIQNVNDQWLELFERGDAAGCAALYTEDGSIHSPYGPVARGTSEIEATHKAWLEAGETNKRITILEGGIQGDLGYCVAAYAGDYPQEDGSTYQTESGKVVCVLKRQADSSWKFHILSLNSDTPPLAE